MTASTDFQAIVIAGVGGFVIRTTDRVERILQLVTPSGRVISFALDDRQAAAVGAKASELELAAMETGEVLRDLGLYEQG
jgi:hypothetical protein